jgi:hypothetical protein
MVDRFVLGRLLVMISLVLAEEAEVEIGRKCCEERVWEGGEEALI